VLFGKPVLLTVLLTVLLLTVSAFFLQGFSPQVWVKGCVQTKNGQKMDRDTEIEIEEKEISRDLLKQLIVNHVESGPLVVSSSLEVGFSSVVDFSFSAALSCSSDSVSSFATSPAIVNSAARAVILFHNWTAKLASGFVVKSRFVFRAPSPSLRLFLFSAATVAQ
jgi:hypothetical protein